MEPATRSWKVLLLFTLTLFAGIAAFPQCSFTVVTTVTNVSCFNGTNGTVTINVTGGTAPYQYQLAEAGAGAWQASTNVYNGLGAGTYPVSVKDASGCIKTSYITVTQPAQLSITYSATDATCTGANNGSINTTTTGGVAPYTYSWTYNGSNFSTQQNILNLTPGNYQVFVTDANGCTATPVIPSQANAISVTGFNADGIANGTFASASTTTSTSMDAHPGQVLYAAGYSNPSGTTKTGGIPASGNFTSARDASRSYQLASYSGNNELLLRSSGDNAAGGATSGTLTFATQYRSTYSVLYVLGTTGSGTGSANYTVNFSDGTTTTGTITFPDWFYTGTTNVALGGLSRLTRSTSAFDGSNNFNLFELPITLSVPQQSKTINSVAFSWSGSGSARINIFGISGYNATGSGIRVNDGSSITVTPSVNVTSNAVSNTFCTGQAVTFTAVPTNGGPTPSYQWKLNGVNVGTNSTTYTNSSLNNNDKVTVVMTSNLICVTANPVTSNQVTMVSGTAPASVSIAASTISVCSGASSTFTATPVNGGASPSYQWKLNGVNVGTNSSTYTSTTFANGDQVRVVMTSSIACATPNPSTSNIVSMSVTQTALPSVTIVSLPLLPKPGNTVLFTATSLFGGLFPSYQWFKNGTAILGATSATLTVYNVVHADFYSVKLNSNYLCATAPAAMSNFIYIGNVTLPLSLDWFRTSKTDNNVVLRWKTSYESNVTGFTIFRTTSSSSSRFVQIGSVNATNLETGSEYNFIDNPPAQGTYTYQLVQIDRDGSQVILGTKIITWNGRSQQSVTDLGNSWRITTDATCQYELIDMQGRIIVRGNIINQFFLPKPAARGIYVLRLYSNGSLNAMKLK